MTEMFGKRFVFGQQVLQLVSVEYLGQCHELCPNA